MGFLTHKTHTPNWPPRSVTEIALLYLYVDDFRNSQVTEMALLAYFIRDFTCIGCRLPDVSDWNDTTGFTLTGECHFHI
jgi:hypothetical protein